MVHEKGVPEVENTSRAEEDFHAALKELHNAREARGVAAGQAAGLEAQAAILRHRAQRSVARTMEQTRGTLLRLHGADVEPRHLLAAVLDFQALSDRKPAGGISFEKEGVLQKFDRITPGTPVLSKLGLAGVYGVAANEPSVQLKIVVSDVVAEVAFRVAPVGKEPTRSGRPPKHHSIVVDAGDTEFMMPGNLALGREDINSIAQEIAFNNYRDRTHGPNLVVLEGLRPVLEVLNRSLGLEIDLTHLDDQITEGRSTLAQ